MRYREIEGQVFNIDGKLLTDGQVIFRLTTIIPVDQRARTQKKEIPDSEIIAEINPDGSIHARLMVPMSGGWDYAAYLPDGSSFEFTLSAAVTTEDAPILLADIHSLTSLKMVGPIKRYIDALLMDEGGTDIRTFGSLKEMLLAGATIEATHMIYVKNDPDAENDGLYISRVTHPTSIDDFDYVQENSVHARSIRTYLNIEGILKDWASLNKGDIVWIVNLDNPRNDGPRQILVNHPVSSADISTPIIPANRSRYVKAYHTYDEMFGERAGMHRGDVAWVYEDKDSDRDGAWIATADDPKTPDLIQATTGARGKSTGVLKTFNSVANLIASGGPSIKAGDLVWVKGDSDPKKDGPYVANVDSPVRESDYTKLSIGSDGALPRSVTSYSRLAGLKVKNNEIVVVNNPKDTFMDGVYVAMTDNPLATSDYFRLSHSVPRSVNSYGTQVGMLADAAHFKAGDVYWVSGDADKRADGVYIVRVDAPTDLITGYSHINLTPPIHAKVFTTQAAMIAGGAGLKSGQTVIVTKDSDATKNGEYVVVEDDPTKLSNFVRLASGSHHHSLADIPKLQPKIDSMEASILARLGATSASVALHTYATMSAMIAGGASLKAGDVTAIVDGPVRTDSVTGRTTATDARLYVAKVDNPALVGDYSLVRIDKNILPEIGITDIAGLGEMLVFSHNSLRTYISPSEMIHNSSSLNAGDFMWIRDSVSPENDGPYIAKISNPSAITDFFHVSIDSNELETYGTLADLLLDGVRIKSGGLVWVAGDPIAANNGAYIAAKDRPALVADFTRPPIGAGDLKSDGSVKMSSAYTPSVNKDIASKEYVDGEVSTKIDAADIGEPGGVAGLNIASHVPEMNLPDHLAQIIIDLKQSLSEKGIANGYVGLDVDTKINPIYLPATMSIPRHVYATQADMVADGAALKAGDLVLVHGDSVTKNNGEYVVTEDTPTDLTGYISLGSTVAKHNHEAKDISVLFEGKTQGLQYLMDNFLTEGTPVGTIMMWPAIAVPTGCLVCDGSAFDAKIYPELSALLGANTVPDLRNAFIRGSSGTRNPLTAEVGATAKPTTNFRTDAQGNHTHTMPSSGQHAHAIQYITQDYDTSHRGGNGPAMGAGGQPGHRGSAYLAMYHGDTANNHTHAINANGNHSHAISTGGDSETRPANVALLYIIKARTVRGVHAGIIPIRYEGVGIAGGLSVLTLNEQANKHLIVVVDGLVLPESEYSVSGNELSFNTPLVDTNKYSIINYAAGASDPHHTYATQAAMLADVANIELGELSFVHGDPIPENNGEYVCITDKPTVITDFEHLGSYIRTHKHLIADVTGLRAELDSVPAGVKSYSSLASFFAGTDKDKIKASEIIYVHDAAHPRASGLYLAIRDTPRAIGDLVKISSTGTAVESYQSIFTMIADGKNLANGDIVWVHGDALGGDGPYYVQISDPTARAYPSDISDFTRLSSTGGGSTGTGGGLDLSILAKLQAKSEKGAVDGYAALDLDGFVPRGQLPLIIPDGIDTFLDADEMASLGDEQIKGELLWVHGTNLVENGPYIAQMDKPVDVADYIKVPMVVPDASGKIPVGLLPPSTSIPHHVFTTRALMLAGGAPIKQGEMILVLGDADSTLDGEYIALQDAPTLLAHYTHLGATVRKHQHAIADTTGLQAALDDKLPDSYMPDGIETFDSVADMASLGFEQKQGELSWVHGSDATENGPYVALIDGPVDATDYTKISLGDSIADIPGLQAALDAKQATSEKGASGGYVPLDASNKVPLINLPDRAIAGVTGLQAALDDKLPDSYMPDGIETFDSVREMASLGFEQKQGELSWVHGSDATENGPYVAKIDEPVDATDYTKIALGSRITGIADVPGLSVQLYNKQVVSEKGASDGYAPLDPAAKVPSIHLPDRAIDDVTGLQSALDDKLSDDYMPDGIETFSSVEEMASLGFEQKEGELSWVHGTNPAENGPYVAKIDEPVDATDYTKISLGSKATSVSDILGLSIALDGKQSTSEKAAADGYAPLDSASKVPLVNLPDRTIAQIAGLQLALDGKLSEDYMPDGIETFESPSEMASLGFEHKQGELLWVQGTDPLDNGPYIADMDEPVDVADYTKLPFGSDIADVPGLQAELDKRLSDDGSVEMSVTFTPTNDRDLVYKKYVDDALAGTEIKKDKGAASGYAPLTTKKKVPLANLPPRSIANVTGLQAELDGRLKDDYMPDGIETFDSVSDMASLGSEQTQGELLWVHGTILTENGPYVALVDNPTDAAGYARVPVATLNASGKIPSSMLPPSTSVPHHIFTTQALMLAGGSAIKQGEMVLVTADTDTNKNGEYVAGIDAPSTIGDYDHLGASTRAHQHAVADVTGLQVALDSKELASEKGVADGYAPLDADSEVPLVNLPTIIPDGISVYETADEMASLGLEHIEGELLWVHGPVTAENGPYVATMDEPVDIADYTKLPVAMFDASGKIPASVLPTIDHVDLTGRDSNAQHPISAITWLREELDRKRYKPLLGNTNVYLDYEERTPGGIPTARMYIQSLTKDGTEWLGRMQFTNAAQAANFLKYPDIPIEAWEYFDYVPAPTRIIALNPIIPAKFHDFTVNLNSSLGNFMGKESVVLPFKFVGGKLIVDEYRMVRVKDNIDVETRVEIHTHLKKDGSTKVDAAFTPTNDRDVVFKKYVDDAAFQAAVDNKPILDPVDIPLLPMSGIDHLPMQLDRCYMAPVSAADTVVKYDDTVSRWVLPGFFNPSFKVFTRLIKEPGHEAEYDAAMLLHSADTSLGLITGQPLVGSKELGFYRGAHVTGAMIDPFMGKVVELSLDGNIPPQIRVDLVTRIMYQDVAEKGNSMGYASLNASGKVPVAQLPPVTAFPHHIFLTVAAMLAGGAAVKIGQMVLVTKDPDANKSGEYVATKNSPSSIADYDHLGATVRTHQHAIADTTGLQTAIDAAEKSANKGVANGYASLDVTGNVPVASLPDRTISQVAGLQTDLDATEKSVNKGIASGYTPLDSTRKVPLANLPDRAIADITGLQTELNDRQFVASKGLPGGYAGLDARGNIPLTQLPPSIAKPHHIFLTIALMLAGGSVVLSGELVLITADPDPNNIGEYLATQDRPTLITQYTFLGGTVRTHRHAVSEVNGLQSSLDAAEAKINKDTPDGYAPLNTGRKVPVANLPDRAILEVTGLQTALADKQETSEKAQAGGYASLDSGAKVPVVQLPPSAAKPHHVFTTVADMLAGGATIKNGEMILVSGDPDPNNIGEYIAKQDAPTLISHYVALGATVRTHTHGIADVPTLQPALDLKQSLSEKGSADGYAPLDATRKVPAVNLPDHDDLSGRNVADQHPISAIAGLQAAIDTTEKSASKGVADGYAPLDATSKVPVANLPAITHPDLTHRNDADQHTIAAVTGLQDGLDAKLDKAIAPDGIIVANVHKTQIQLEFPVDTRNLTSYANYRIEVGSRSTLDGLKACTGEIRCWGLLYHATSHTLSDATAAHNKITVSQVIDWIAGRALVSIIGSPDLRHTAFYVDTTAIIVPDDAEMIHNKGEAGGYASLDVTSRLPNRQLPHIITDVALKRYAEITSLTQAEIATTKVIDFEKGTVHRVSLIYNVAITIAGVTGNGLSGSAFSATLLIIQDRVGNRTVTWPTDMKWAGGTAPTLSTAPNSIDIFTIVTHDSGVTWFGFTSGLDMK